MSDIESSKTLARLETSMGNLAEQVSKLTGTVEKNNERLERLAVLENNHTSTNAALNRAFDAIERAKGEREALENKIDQRFAKLEGKVSAKHAGYDRYIYMALGFVTAISIVWSVVAVQINATVNAARDRTARFEAHLSSEKHPNGR